MESIMKSVKKLIRTQLKRSVLKQKNEWPATSVPIYFQPARPKKNEKQGQESLSQK